MKAAYKDLRSKLREKPVSTSNGSFGETSMTQSHHFDASGSSIHAIVNQMHSAPNSPVFTKKLELVLSHHPHQNSPNRLTNPEHQQQQRHQQHHHHHLHHPNNPTSNSFSVNSKTPTATRINNNNRVATKSAAARGGSSSSSSDSSASEMNLLQELQQHALFRAPVGYRSSVSAL